MPTYDYKCSSCEHEMEVFQAMSDEPLSQCPQCGMETLRRMVGGGLGVIFKGSGFYINDSKKSSDSKKSETNKDKKS